MRRCILSCFVLASLLGAIAASAQDSLGVTCVRRVNNYFDDTQDLAVSGDYAYALGYPSEVLIIDLTTPELPVDYGVFFIPISELWAPRIMAQDNLLYVIGSSGMVIYDISSPLRPALECIYDSTANLSGIGVRDTLLILGTRDSTLIILNTVDPSSPHQITSMEMGYPVRDIDVVDDIAFISGDQFLALDISNPYDIQILGSYDQWAMNAEIAGDYAYLAADTEGIAILDISTLDGIEWLTSVDMNDGTDVAVTGDLMVAGYDWYYGEDEYGRYVGHFICAWDVSEPHSPTYLGVIEVATSYAGEDIHAPANSVIAYSGRIITNTDRVQILSQDAEVVGELRPSDPTLIIEQSASYLCTASGPRVKLFQLTDPITPQYINSVCPWVYGGIDDFTVDNDLLGLTYGESIFYLIDISQDSEPQQLAYGSVRNHSINRMLLRDALLYLGHLGGSFSIFDVSDSRHPQLRSTTVNETNVADFASDAFTLFIAGGDNGVLAYDIRDPSLPQELWRLETPGSVRHLSLSGDRLYLTDGALLIYDVSDPAQPEELGHFVHEDWSAYALTVKESVAYVSFYPPYESGLRGQRIFLLNVSDPAEISVIGYYDTYASPSSFIASPPYLYSAEYRLWAIYDCSAALSAPPSSDFILHPSSFILSCYPNPFNSSTTIKFNLPTPGPVHLEVYDPLGRRVRELIPGSWLAAGEQTLLFNGEELSSGVYLLKARSGGATTEQKVAVTR